jgi:hypothetical protein
MTEKKSAGASRRCDFRKKAQVHCVLWMITSRTTRDSREVASREGPYIRFFQLSSMVEHGNFWRMFCHDVDPSKYILNVT